MGQGKQAKVLTETQIKAVLAAVDGRRYPKRDRVMVLLSIRAGLRAKEIAMARWSMVSDAEGNIGDAFTCRTRPARARMVAALFGFAPNCATPWWRFRPSVIRTRPTILSTASAMPA